MITIDTHQHYWKYNEKDFSWVTDNMAILRKDYLPAHFQSILKENKVDGTIAVQAAQSEEETEFLLSLAQQHPFIKGVVGWVDLKSPACIERLKYFSSFSLVKGFRHILQSAPPSFMLETSFLKGIEQLLHFSFTYDILIYPQHLPATIEFVKEFPTQKFMIDHVAKPYIKEKKIEEWAEGMQALSQYPNVYCKLSGMSTEADHIHWKETDLMVYMEVIVKAFGINRICYGSDWPVCLVSTSYTRWINFIRSYFSSFSKENQEKVMGKNAVSFYSLTNI